MEKNAKIEQTEEFIFSFQTEKCLWDVCCKEYHDRNLKEKSLEGLADKFKISGKRN